MEDRILEANIFREEMPYRLPVNDTPFQQNMRRQIYMERDIKFALKARRLPEGYVLRYVSYIDRFRRGELAFLPMWLYQIHVQYQLIEICVQGCSFSTMFENDVFFF